MRRNSSGTLRLSDADLERPRRKREGVTRLGFAAQLTTLRFLGTFLETPGNIPENALAFLRVQLGLLKRVTLEPYSAAQLLWRHREEIRALEQAVNRGFRVDQAGGDVRVVMR